MMKIWSALPDNLSMPVESSLILLEGLHSRLGYLMKNLSETELEKTFVHPENNSEYKIKQIIGIYAWHSNHHLAHITSLKKLKKWQ